MRARAYNEAGICPNYAYYEEEFWGTTIPLSTGFVGVDEVALPSTVYTAVNGDGTVTIGWRPAGGANGGYVGDVSYALEENGQSVAAADPAYDEASGRFQCTTTVLEPGLHTFVLTAGNGLGNGEYTAAVVAVYATGESEKAMKDFEVKGVGNEFPASVADAVLYPNPSDGRFHISVPKACRMQLYSIAGRMIGQRVLAAGLQEFDLRALPAGTYYVRLVAGDEAVVLKAVIR